MISQPEIRTSATFSLDPGIEVMQSVMIDDRKEVMNVLSITFR